MRDRHLISAVAVLAVISFVAAFGCSRKTTTIETEEGKITFEEGKEFKIKTDEGTLTMRGGTLDVKTKEGKASLTVGHGELPENISGDIPIYKPSNVAMSQVMEGGKNVILSLSTSDDASKVKVFYEDQMGKKGWNINRRMSMGPATILSGSKGNKKLNVTLTREEDETIISLAFQEK